MAETKLTNMIVPEVFADMMQAEFVGQTRVLGSAATITDNTLVGQPGDTIHFPKWNAIGELDDLSEAVAMTPVVMGTSDNEATIKEAGKAVEISDLAELAGMGSAAQEARRQFAVLAARKVDADLIAAAQATTGSSPNVHSPYDLAAKGKLTWKVMLGAIGEFGDEWEPSDFAGLYVNSLQWGEIASTEQFVDAAKLGASTPVTTGTVGSFGGVPVILTNRVAQDTALLIKRGALGALYKRQPLIEQDRDILKRTNVLTVNVHYATKRLNDKGVCVISLNDSNGTSF